MNRIVATILSIPIFLLLSCSKETREPSPLPERTLSMPEKVEKEFADVLSKDWKSLSDTLSYFNSNLLSKGHFKGTAPDGVFYRLDFSLRSSAAVAVGFIVEDSTFVTLEGRIFPLAVSLHAFGSEIAIKRESADSLSLCISNLKVKGPILFFLNGSHQAGLLYDDERVGYITRERLENPDYSTGTYPVIHYYNDPRTFALYDRGLFDLLKTNLDNVLQ